jgi:GntR family transcriptional repressor for pyruvate dehydrogenase complex
MFASLEQPLTFLLHDITFHRAIARASHNPILASLIEMVSAMFYEQRKANVGAVRDLREAAEMHRLIYQALRDKDGDAAQAAMSEHLRVAAAFKGTPPTPAGPGAEPPAGGRGPAAQ